MAGSGWRDRLGWLACGTPSASQARSREGPNSGMASRGMGPTEAFRHKAPDDSPGGREPVGSRSGVAKSGYDVEQLEWAERVWGMMP